MIDSISDSAGSGPDLKKARRRKPARDQQADRLPPHTPMAEQGVLGCVLLAPNECLPQLAAKLTVDAFYDLRHQTIYEVLLDMLEANQPIDVITLQQKLKDKGLLEQIGGIPYLNSLQDGVPSAANLAYYMELVAEKHVLRRAIHTCTDVVARIYEFEGEVDELMDEVEHDLLKLTTARNTSHAREAKTLVPLAIDEIEAMHQRQGKLPGLTTGLSDLDRFLQGMRGGQMIVLAARPSIGKTTLAMQIAEHVVLDLKEPVVVFSLEMTAEELMLRQLASHARVNVRKLTEDGFLAETDFPRLTTAAGKFSHAPLYIDDTPGLSILQLRGRARVLWQMYKIKLIVVDYLQLLHTTSKRAENRQQEIADISGGLKALAKELHVPVVAVSQLNREMEKMKRRPNLSDLRESGAIEQDADVVGLLYRKDDVADAEPSGGGTEESPVATGLLIAKQRNGPTGEVHLQLLKHFTRFMQEAKVSPTDVPPDRKAATKSRTSEPPEREDFLTQ